jgi:nucleoside-diphosphate-sugar epimerase
MTAVVTGAAGFIGSHLAAALRQDGCDVVGIDRRQGASVTIAGDLATPPPEMVDALRDADVVFHLAGCGGVRGNDSARWWHDNVVATETVLALVAAPTTLVVTSSSSVYGGARYGRPSRESDRLHPVGGYARSKVAVERRCAARLAAGGAVAVARPFTVAGERQRPDMALARWIEAARSGRPLLVYGSLDRRRDVTDVDAVVRGLRALADRGVVGTVNLGTGHPRTLAEMASAVQAAVGPVPVEVVAAHPDEVPATWADTTRCERLLGFRPETDLCTLVARQVAARSATGHVLRG